MGIAAFNPDEKCVLGQSVQDRIVRISGINPLTNRAASVADEIIVAVDVLGALHKLTRVEQGLGFSRLKLFLTPHIGIKAQATLRLVSGFSGICCNGSQIVIVNIWRNMDGISQKHFPQERDFHRFALTIVGNRFGHVTGADPVIDRVVKPCAGLLKHLGNIGFAQARHRKQNDPLVRSISPFLC